jgi:hypothetical protein
VSNDTTYTVEITERDAADIRSALLDSSGKWRKFARKALEARDKDTYNTCVRISRHYSELYERFKVSPRSAIFASND